MRNPAAEVIVAAIGCIVSAIAAVSLALEGHPAWGCVLAGAAVAYAIVFAVARTEMLEERRKVEKAVPRVPRAPDFPEQRKHDVC